MTKDDERLVSVITPAYKAASFVGTTIESVLAQDYPHWEMIIVDDKSPDETAELIQSYADRDPRIKPVQLPVNAGAANARNVALERARGRYVAFLDSDDLWLPSKLRTQLEFMHSAGAAFSFTAFRRISQDGARTGHIISVPRRLDYVGLLKNTAIATSTVIVDRDVVGPFRMIRTYYDDLALWLTLLKRGVVAHGLRLDLARYRVVARSISRNKLNSALQVWRTYRDVERLGLPRAAWGFAHYAVRATIKYGRF